MHLAPTWTIDPTQILTRRELATVLADARRQAGRSNNAHRNLIVIRLACCCGLRVSEIAGLRMDDVVVTRPRPHLRLPAEITKGNRPRRVPLWWDAGTLADLEAWKVLREAQRARGHDPFVCSVQQHHQGRPLQRHAVRPGS